MIFVFHICSLYKHLWKDNLEQMVVIHKTCINAKDPWRMVSNPFLPWLYEVKESHGGKNISNPFHNWIKIELVKVAVTQLYWEYLVYFGFHSDLVLSHLIMVSEWPCRMLMTCEMVTPNRRTRWTPRDGLPVNVRPVPKSQRLPFSFLIIYLYQYLYEVLSLLLVDTFLFFF